MGYCGGRHQSHHRPEPVQSKESSPLDILKERLARGVIAIDEYKEMVKVLTGANTTHAFKA